MPPSDMQNLDLNAYFINVMQFFDFENICINYMLILQNC